MVSIRRSTGNAYIPRALSATLVYRVRIASLLLIGVQQVALSTTNTIKQSLSVVHGVQPMPAPFTTILSTITVTDVNSALVSNASVVSLTVAFPDQTTSILTLAGGGISNLGSGQYQAKYNTKMPGPTREVWSVTAADGITIGSAQFDIGVGY